jgi:hypothetical protein
MADNDVTVVIHGKNEASSAIKQVSKDLDAIAAKAKASFDKQAKVDIDTQLAKGRIADLDKQIAALKAKAASGKLTVGDTSELRKAQGELHNLQDALDDVGDAAGKAKSPLEQIGDLVGGKLTKMFAVTAIAGAVVQVGKLATELGNLGQEVQQQRAYFNVWSGGVTNATANLAAMREAIGGVMTDSEAMTGANKLLSMGLAKNADELAKLSKMAVMLGGSTRSAAESIDEFSLLLANQSILRLDTFGISGATVRARIEELMATTAGLTREQAFLNAVMEEGTRKVSALEAAGVSATTATQDLDTAFRGLKEAVGVGLAGPIAEAQSNLAETLNQLATLVRGTNILNDVLTLDPGSEAQLVAITQRLEYLRDLVERSASGENIYRFNAENALREIAELEAKLVALTPVNETVAASAGVAAVRMADSINDVEGAVDDLHSTLGETTHWDKFVALGQAAANKVKSEMLIARAASMGIDVSTDGAPEPSKTQWGLYTDYARKVAGASQSQSEIDQLIQDWKEKVGRANTDTADDFARKYQAAIDDLTGDVKSKLGGAIQDSIGLKDMAGDPFAPGANGPFEAIFRAQAVAVGGIENADEQRWAEMYGLTPESAAKIVSDFQKGLFTADVQKLIDVNALVGQIQGEQAAAESTAAFANMIAGKLGVTDAGALVASQTFQAIAGGVQADDTQQANAAKAVLEAYATNVQAVVKSDEYSGRMIGFGTSTWVYYEQGLLKGAQGSSVFEQAVGAAVAAWLISRGYGSGVVNEGRAGGSRP